MEASSFAQEPLAAAWSFLVDVSHLAGDSRSRSAPAPPSFTSRFSTESVVISGGTLPLDAASTISSLTINGGTLNNDGENEHDVVRSAEDLTTNRNSSRRSHRTEPMTGSPLTLLLRAYAPTLHAILTFRKFGSAILA